jgi:hypothetical protein
VTRYPSGCAGATGSEPNPARAEGAGGFILYELQSVSSPARCICGRPLPCPRRGEHGLIPVIIVGVVATLVGGVALGIDPVVDFVKGAVEALAAVADAAIALLPDASDLDLDAQTGWLRGYSYFNTFLPIPEALGMVAVLITVRLAIFTWRLADRVWHMIPKPLSGT